MGIELWLYDGDYVDLARRRQSFLAADWRTVTRADKPRRALSHTPAGVPTLVRERPRRRIHVSCEYLHVAGRDDLRE
jgi:hypothetical protein